MSVKRYSPGCCPQEPMTEQKSGRYVQHADYSTLKEENEAFRQERKDLIYELHRLALVEQSLKARVAEMGSALKLALEYWQHRQQRYKNRFPAWVREARAAIDKWK